MKYIRFVNLNICCIISKVRLFENESFIIPRRFLYPKKKGFVIPKVPFYPTVKMDSLMGGGGGGGGGEGFVIWKVNCIEASIVKQNYRNTLITNIVDHRARNIVPTIVR